MSEILHLIFAASTYTYAMTGVMLIWSALIIRTMTESNTLALLMAPFIGFGALAGVYVFRELGIVFTPDRDANIIAAAGAGMCCSIVALLGFGRFSTSLADMRKTGLEDRIDPTIAAGGPTPKQPFSR